MQGAICFRHIALHPFLAFHLVGWGGVARIVVDVMKGNHCTFLSYISTQFTPKSTSLSPNSHTESRLNEPQ